MYSKDVTFWIFLNKHFDMYLLDIDMYRKLKLGVFVNFKFIWF